MKQPFNIILFLKVVAILLLVGFVIRLGADYYQYYLGLKSQPFYYYVIGRSFLFIIPSILCALGAHYIKVNSVR